MIAVLDGTVTYEIDADQLTLTKGDTGLIYRARLTPSGHR